MATNGTSADSQNAASSEALRKKIIPLIDFSPFLNPSSPEAKTETARAVVQAFRTSGFIYLSNFGIPPKTVNRTFELSAKFFSRSYDEKESLAWTTPESNRGYSGPGREKVSVLEDKDKVEQAREEEGADLKESFEIGKEGEGPGKENQWLPEDDREGAIFKTEMLDLFDDCKRLHSEVMRAVAVGLGIDETWFDRFTDDGDNTLRLLHYPAVKKEVFKVNKAQVRAGAHSDYGSITLLFQDSRGGLQVQAPDGSFVNATPIIEPPTIVVNAGDLLARWSNDLIKSTIHRVVEPPAPEEGDEHPPRYSIAYFCNPNFKSFIDVIPNTIQKGETKKYQGIYSGDYLVQRLTATY